MSRAAAEAAPGMLGATAADIAAAVRAGKVPAATVAEAHLERIGGPGASLNAVVASDRDAALAAAAAVDEAVAAGVDPGPLAGVPMTVKEAFAVAGMPATAGMPERAGMVASRDAPAVAALRAAGAVILGVTNLPRQLADLQTDNPVYGTTRNPWDPQRSPGGSSGGSAAAVAAGLVAADLGSDLSGSIRVPASWCGVYGLRPSNGLVSKRGHLPWPLDGLLEPPTSVVGPLARSVADLRLVLAALTAPNAKPLTARTATPPAPPAGALRVGVWAEHPGAPVGAETAAVLDAAAGALSAAGATVAAVTPPLDAGALELGWRLIHAEITHGLTAEQWDTAGGALRQTVRDHLDDAEARLQLSARWDAAMQGWDALLCPAVAVAARPHDPSPRTGRTVIIDGEERPFDDLAAWSVLASVGHMPSVTFPAGLGGESGLPVGLQLIGRWRRDAELLAVAAAVDAVIGGYVPPPGWFASL
ncbi:hypothetical protein K6U06_02340 [Acidiferrimicrobium sp. IK]|uniref:amidase family protein n=1 Tax=Acidiferrimicrobium sp. IK TaxID=2871700 RepID=UPI0021CB52ED|nr:amidase family protein [Acidiferrimicrobium sp. IK]MCU4183184.1 hypothetical protein [Acidiferrimicrobium sp. IK]